MGVGRGTTRTIVTERAPTDVCEGAGGLCTRVGEASRNEAVFAGRPESGSSA